jgi:FkbM family methyltransferase
MKFISYAQNFEDVILWRALKDIKNGFYIDVGANDPTIDSVTKAFYDKGWSGVNIDPSLKAYDNLLRARPRDTNLNIAVGDINGELTFYDISISGWSTLDSAVAQKHRNDGVQVSHRAVSVRKLLDICKQYVDGDIHFLKIDVEGAEELVIGGMEFAIYRPWIIVVEATLPDSTVANFENWEPKILSGNYEYAYFDGLNRFYIAHEHIELKKHFSVPPNIFDNFVLHAQADLGTKLSNATHDLLVAQNEAFHTLHASKTRENEALAKLDEIRNSRAWQITVGLRKILGKARELREKMRPKSLLKKAITIAANIDNLKKLVIKVAYRFPRIEEKIKLFYSSTKPVQSEAPVKKQDVYLGASERVIFERLKEKVKSKKGHA